MQRKRSESIPLEVYGHSARLRTIVVGQPKAQPRIVVVSNSGFSLIEFIGVLAILAVLSLAVVEVFIKHADLAAGNMEIGTMNTISNAFVAQVLRTQQIPDATTWAASTSKFLALPVASLTNNAHNFARICLIDPSGWFGSATLPYTSNSAGTQISSPARIMIISSLSANPPVTNGMAPDANTFNTIWNTPQGNVPSTWMGWNGRADDLFITRLDLQPQFDLLVLVNRDTNNAAVFSINGTIPSTVTSDSIASAFYLAGSVVGLFSTNSGATNLQSSQMLSHNLSLVFENGVWGGQIGVGPPALPAASAGSGLAGSFQTNALAFLAAADNPRNSGASGIAGDQEQVLAAMSDFMAVYALWANDVYNTHGVSPGQKNQASQISIYNYVTESTNWLFSVSGPNINLKNTPYYSGLLY